MLARSFLSLTSGWALLSRGEKLGVVLLVTFVITLLVWIVAQLLHPLPPTRITFASGPPDGFYHAHAQRYGEILRRSGVRVEERTTAGSAENLALLSDAVAPVDVALLQGGIASPGTTAVEMLAAVFYEPLWIFHRTDRPINQINQLRGKRIAVGAPGGGTGQFVEPLLRANGITDGSATLVPLGIGEGVAALKQDQVDAVFAVGSPAAPVIQAALLDREFTVMTMARADAYPRRFPHISLLRLPQGTLDLGSNAPPTELALIGTQAMLVARADLHPAIVDLLIDAARELHSAQGYFEMAGEFPRVAPVDIPVSEEAVRYFKQGTGLLHRHLPFWVATFVERLIVVVLPVLVIVTPIVSRLPSIIAWRMRSRIARWYRTLEALERAIESNVVTKSPEDWVAEVERIKRLVERERTLTSYASELYTLREHIELVRRTLAARAKLRNAHETADPASTTSGETSRRIR